MQSRHLSWAIAIIVCGVLAAALWANRADTGAPQPNAVANGDALADLPPGWQTAAPRDEIRPDFAFEPTGGPKRDGAFIISHDEREGLHGYFHITLPVTGGNHYRFHAVRKVENVAVPRRSCVVRILWRDNDGKSVAMSEPPATGYLVGFRGRRRGRTSDRQGHRFRRLDRGFGYLPGAGEGDARGCGTALPLGAAREGGMGRRVAEGSGEAGTAQGPPRHRALSSLRQVAASQLRGVRAAHRGGREGERRPRRARRDADLLRDREVVRGLRASRSPVPPRSTSANWPSSTTSTSSRACSNAIATSSTTSRCCSGRTARIAGKYRKVCLPRGEVEKGIAPGSEYPGLRDAFRQARHDGVLRRLLPGGGSRTHQSRCGSHRLAGLGLQPGPRLGPRLREPRLHRQQHLRGRVAKLDALGGLRPRRAAAREGRAVEHRRDGRGRSRSAAEVEQSGRLQGPPAPPSTAGAGRGRQFVDGGVRGSPVTCWV